MKPQADSSAPTLMAQINTYPIRCPECKGQQDEALYDSVNVSTEPELRKLLLSNQLNAVTCQGCGHRFRVDKNLLVHNSEAGWMLYLLPRPLSAHREAEEEFRDVLQDLRDVLPEGGVLPPVDLVLSRVELVERLFVREAGLNERVVEYIKYMIYTQNLDQMMPEESALLFNAQDSTEEHLCFVVQDTTSHKLEGALQYTREGYEAILELYQDDPVNGLIAQLFPGPYISARAYLMDEAI